MFWCYLDTIHSHQNSSFLEQFLTTEVSEPFSKKCDIWQKSATFDKKVQHLTKKSTFDKKCGIWQKSATFDKKVRHLTKKCDIWQKKKLKKEVLKFGLLFRFTWSLESLLQEIDN